MLSVLKHTCQLDGLNIRKGLADGAVSVRLKLTIPLSDEEVQELPVIGPAAMELLAASRDLMGEEGKNSHHLDTKHEFDTMSISFMRAGELDFDLAAFPVSLANKPRFWAVEGSPKLVLQLDAAIEPAGLSALAPNVGIDGALLLTSVCVGQTQLDFGDDKGEAGEDDGGNGGNGQLSPEELKELESMGVMALRKKAAEMGIRGMTGKPKELVIIRIVEHLS